MKNDMAIICALLCCFSIMGCLGDRLNLTKHSIGKTREFKRGETFSVKLDGTFPLEAWKLSSYDKTILTLVSQKTDAESPASGSYVPYMLETAQEILTLLEM